MGTVRTLGRSIHVAVEPHLAPGAVGHALFDFDGTLSLLRAGWQEVMVGYFAQVLEAADPGAEPGPLRAEVLDFVTRLTGRQTIYQALELESRVRRRGAQPMPGAHYKAEYLRRLHERIDHRREALRRGEASPAAYLVPGSERLLAGLTEAGVTCHLASGTDVEYVREEADLLGLTRYFADGGGPPRIHGAVADYRSYSKAIVIAGILRDHGLRGEGLVAFGDGFVEIEETRRAGGVAVGVASREDGGKGFDEWKANRLLAVGAHVLVPDWEEADLLLGFLGVAAA